MGTKETTIEPAHEALLRQWGLLQGWLKEDAALLTVLDGIKRAARDWAAYGKTTSWLAHTEGRLRTAERLFARPDFAAALEPTDKDYVASCRRAEQAAHVRARRSMALVGVLVGLLAMVGVGWWNQDILEAILTRTVDDLKGEYKPVYQWHVMMGPSVLTVQQEKEKAAKPGSEFKECATGCPTMVVVPAGKFTMGSPESEQDRWSDEGPQHEVTIARPFAVGKTEVTLAEWGACVAASACQTAGNTGGRGDGPVSNVSWHDAQQYVAWLSRITGKGYRLLTEAEWEYAARAGTTTSYSWGNDIGTGNASCDGCGGQWDRRGAPVGSFKPNAFGLYDMHGNVSEWVEDIMHASYEGAPTDGSPWVKDTDDSLRIVRGGAWFNAPRFLRGAFRGKGAHPNTRNEFFGFRLARTLNP